MAMLNLVLGFLVSSFALFASPIHAYISQGNTLIDLGVPGSLSRAHGINNSGLVVGEYDSSTNTAFMWQNGIVTSLGPGDARAVNNLGQIVGSGANGQAVLWSNGSSVDLASSTDGLAFGINDNSEAVGVYSNTSAQPFSWQVGVLTPLAIPTGSLAGIALVINNSGTIVGFVQDSDGTRHATIWKNGAVIRLDNTLPLGWKRFVSADGINAAGKIVGTGYRADDLLHGFLYDGTTYTDLGITLHEGQAINTRDQVVGFDQGYVWQGGTLTTLAFVPPPGYFNDFQTPGQTGAYGINDLGEVVGGANIPSPIPEPTAISLGGLGLLGTAIQRLLTCQVRRTVLL